MRLPWTARRYTQARERKALTVYPLGAAVGEKLKIEEMGDNMDEDDVGDDVGAHEGVDVGADVNAGSGIQEGANESTVPGAVVVASVGLGDGYTEESELKSPRKNARPAEASERTSIEGMDKVPAGIPSELENRRRYCFT